MGQVDPSVFYGPSIFPPPGWLRTGVIGGVPVLLENWDIKVSADYSYNSFAQPVPMGPKQKTLHARGTSEVSFDLRGELTEESTPLILLLSPQFRGVPLGLEVQQQGSSNALDGCYVGSFNLSASSGQPVKFQLMGNSINWPVAGGSVPMLTYQHLVPSWATGNSLVESWNLKLTIPLIPVWRNGQSVLPTYYRFGDAECWLESTTVGQLQPYDSIALGVGGYVISGMVTAVGLVSSGRGVQTYPVAITSVDVFGNTLSEGAEVAVSAPTYQGSPDGV